MGLQMIVSTIYSPHQHSLPCSKIEQATLALHFTMYFLPESPRWLVQHDRHEEALVVLAKLHSGGNQDDTYVQSELGEIRAKIALEKLYPAPSYFQLLFGSEWRRMYIGIGVVGIYETFFSISS
jgi:hypothetical protein